MMRQDFAERGEKNSKMIALVQKSRLPTVNPLSFQVIE